MRVTGYNSRSCHTAWGHLQAVLCAAAALKLYGGPLQVLNSYAEQEVAADARIAAVRLRHLSLTHQQQKLEATLKQKVGSCCQCSVAAACAGLSLLHLAHLMTSCPPYVALRRSGLLRGERISKACFEAMQGMHRHDTPAASCLIQLHPNPSRLLCRRSWQLGCTSLTLSSSRSRTKA